MSFTSINGMRSARYPLQGAGCGCGYSGLGQTSPVRMNWMPWAIGGVTVLGLGVASYLAIRPMRRNGRRRRRGRG